MKKLLICILIVAVALVTFVACDLNSEETHSIGTEPFITPDPGPNPEPAPEYVELDNVSLDGGDYVYGNTVYSFDKMTRQMTVNEYYYYSDYKIKRAAQKYYGVVKYVESIYADSAVYFEIQETKCYLAKVDDAVKLFVKSGSSLTTTTLKKLDSAIIEIDNGTYVTDKQEQTVDGVKEEFYLFFVLTDTTASIYVSDNNTTYTGEPLYSTDDIKAQFVSGYARIKIPHNNGSYSCSITFKGSEGISLLNSYERNGDYSCSGTLTKLS